MFSITFDFVKCSATQRCAKMLCFLLCKKQRCVHFVLLNIFLWKMYALRCKNAFLHQMHFCIKCICNILLHKMYASNAFLHQQNVTNAFDAKMLCFLLCKKQRCCPYILLVQKCIFANQNVRKRQNAFWLCKNAFDAKMHLMQKCIFATQRVHFTK